MRKIFYHPDTLEIMGMTDGFDALEYPSVETEEDYHSTLGLSIVLGEESGDPELHIDHGVWEDSVPEEMVEEMEEQPEPVPYYDPPGPPEEEEP